MTRWTRPTLTAFLVSGLSLASACTGDASETRSENRDAGSGEAPPAKPSFTNAPLKIVWDSPIVPTEDSAKNGAVTTRRLGGRVRTGQPFRVRVDVPSTNRPIANVVLTFDGAPCSLRAPTTVGYRFVAMCSVDIDRDPGDGDLVLNADVVAPKADAGTAKNPFTKTLSLQVVSGDYDERSLRVKKKYVKPPRRVQARIERDRETIKRALAERSFTPTSADRWVRPVDKEKEETSPFGTLRTYNNERQSRHLGLDLDGKTGDPIVAIAPGRVVLVEERYYSGGTVVVDHGGTMFSLYFHMSRFDVKEGEEVRAGQTIGAVGRSGRVTGPHLHLSVKIGGHYIDPKTLLAFSAIDADKENAGGSDLRKGKTAPTIEQAPKDDR